MAEVCQIAKAEESHLEGFKCWWEFPGYNVLVATLISPLHGVLCSSVWHQHERSIVSNLGGSSPISLYTLSLRVCALCQALGLAEVGTTNSLWFYITHCLEGRTALAVT